jgi:uncharacterized membrane protein (DUF485 family)
MEQQPPNTDLTPVTGSATDVAPLGRGGQKPAHELTADEDIDAVEWDGLAALADFKALLAAKRRFIVPATVFFIVYYFALPVLVGYAPRLMAAKVFGVVNVAYLFALSQFFVAWLVALLYVRAASRFDAMARAVVDQFKARPR